MKKHVTSYLLVGLVLSLAYGCSGHQMSGGEEATVLGLKKTELPPAPEGTVEDLTYVKLANQRGTVLNGATVAANEIIAYGWVDDLGNFSWDQTRNGCFYVPKFHETDCLISFHINLESDGTTINPKNSDFGVSNGQASVDLWITGKYEKSSAIQYKIEFPDSKVSQWYLPMAMTPAQ